MIMKLLSVVLLLEVCLLIIFMASTAITQIEGVEYQVLIKANRTKGSTRFEKEIGISYAMDVLASASDLTWQILKQGPSERKNFHAVRLFIEDFEGTGITRNSDISISASYLGDFTGDVKDEFTRILYHEVVHVWQWGKNTRAPEELINGIADFVTLKAIGAPTYKEILPGDHLLGKRKSNAACSVSLFQWKIMQCFLEFLNGIKEGFVGELDRRLKRQYYSDSIFVELLGKTINMLWKEFQQLVCDTGDNM